MKPYDIPEPQNGWRDIASFTAAEKEKLRPIAETLAMLDGNAFLTNRLRDGREWYEQYLTEAAALYEANGGDTGWAGEASFAVSGTSRLSPHGDSGRSITAKLTEFNRARQSMLGAFGDWARSPTIPPGAAETAAAETYGAMKQIAWLAERGR